jgi:hypothetical protein
MSVGDFIFFIPPAAIGVGLGKFIITEKITASGSENENYVVCKSKSNPSLRVSVKIKDISMNCNSLVASRNYPPPISLTIRTDFGRGGFSHNFVEMRRKFVPFHEFLMEKQKQQHQQIQQIPVQNLSNVSNESQNLYSDKLVSPRTMLRRKRLEREATDEDYQKQKSEQSATKKRIMKYRLSHKIERERKIMMELEMPMNIGGCSMRGFRNATTFSNVDVVNKPQRRIASVFLPTSVRSFFTTLNNQQ